MQVITVKIKQKTQAVCVITIKQIKMSEQERIQEKTSKLVVGSTFLILAVTMLFLSSCGSSSYTSCAAYASVEVENELK